MKTLLRVSRLLVMILIAASAAVAADQGSPPERVLFREGKVFAVRGGKPTEINENVTLPNAITVFTNGAFTVGSGKQRMFKEGQVLSADGMLLSSDGSLVPVFDHVVMQSGRPVIVKDGLSAPVTAELALGNGARVLPDGTFVDRDGRRTKLLDGQMRRLDGQNIASTDTVTLIKGKVVLQKDGSRLELTPTQTIAMSDGTKVFGDGTVIKRDGTKVKLTEGQILAVEGVSTRPR